MNSSMKSLIMKELKINENWIISESEDVLLAFTEGDCDHYKVVLANSTKPWKPSRLHLITMAIDSRLIVGNDQFTECTEKIFKCEGDPRIGEIGQKVIDIAKDYAPLGENVFTNLMAGTRFNVTFYRYCMILYSVLYSDQKRKDPDPIIIKTKSLIDGKNEFVCKHICGSESVFGKLVTMDAIRRTRYIDEIMNIDENDDNDSKPENIIDNLYKSRPNETYRQCMERIGNLICETMERMKIENIL